MRNKILGLFALLLPLLLAGASWGTAKVYMTNGETRIGFVHVLDARVTIRGEDRLYQFPERAVHRIEHVTGDTALVGRDDVFLREKMEKMSKNLVFIPKGCEVIIHSASGAWVQAEVYGGQRRAKGYLLAEDLSDSVFMNPPAIPNLKFKAPPPSLKDRYPDRKKQIKPGGTAMENILSNYTGADETDFSSLSLKLYGQPLDEMVEEQRNSLDQQSQQSSQDEQFPSQPLEPNKQ